jgi:hypothetical protein
MGHVRTFDLSRPDSGRRIASDKPEGWPLWSLDGRRLATQSRHVDLPRDRITIREFTSDGAVAATNVLPGPADGYTQAWTIGGDLTRTELLFPSFSPDGRWLAYETRDEGRHEVFIRSYPDSTIVRQVSGAGGIEPRWMASGELFFRWGQRWYSTQVTTDPQLKFDLPVEVFNTRFIDTPGMSYDVARDGKRLLVVKHPYPVERFRIELIPNWLALLERI